MPNERVRKRRRCSVAHAKASSGWIDRELSECTFRDERLAQRLRSLLEQMSTGPGESIPLVCQDWANTKAAYRFLDNDAGQRSGDPGGALPGDARALRTRRVARYWSSMTRPSSPSSARTRRGRHHAQSQRRGDDRRRELRHYTGCGILMHSSLAVTTEGLPLGLAAVEVLDAREVQRHQRPQAARSIRRVCRSRRRRASAGWRICGSRRSCSASPHAACTSVIARATFMSCSARPESRNAFPVCAPAWTDWPVTEVIRSPQEMAEVRARGCIGSRCGIEMASV